MGLFGWKKEETSLVPVEAGKGIERAMEMVTRQENTDIQKVDENSDIVIHKRNHIQRNVIQARGKLIKINGSNYKVDHYQLIRMIKQVTQTIGEYKNKENPFSEYVTGALRKARSDMVSDLEHHFGIHWEIDSHTGSSNFFI